MVRFRLAKDANLVARITMAHRVGLGQRRVVRLGLHPYIARLINLRREEKRERERKRERNVDICREFVRICATHFAGVIVLFKGERSNVYAWFVRLPSNIEVKEHSGCNGKGDGT